MIVTPETVKAEMDYRLERANAHAALDHARAALETRRPWWRRALGHRGGQPPATVNQVRPAT